MKWEFLGIAVVIVGTSWVWVSELVKRRQPGDPSMFDYASWPSGAYAAVRWAGVLCFVVFDVVIVYGLLGMAFGWFESYGDDWWMAAFRVGMVMALVYEMGTVLDFLTNGKPIKARTQNWYSLNPVRKRRFFFTYAIGMTALMIAANIFIWLVPT